MDASFPAVELEASCSSAPWLGESRGRVVPHREGVTGYRRCCGSSQDALETSCLFLRCELNPHLRFLHPQWLCSRRFLLTVCSPAGPSLVGFPLFFPLALKAATNPSVLIHNLGTSLAFCAQPHLHSKGSSTYSTNVSCFL